VDAKRGASPENGRPATPESAPISAGMIEARTSHPRSRTGSNRRFAAQNGIPKSGRNLSDDARVVKRTLRPRASGSRRTRGRRESRRDLRAARCRFDRHARPHGLLSGEGDGAPDDRPDGGSNPTKPTRGRTEVRAGRPGQAADPGSTAIPGPIVQLMVTDCMYTPFAVAGFCRLRASTTVERFCCSWSAEKDALPMGA